MTRTILILALVPILVGCGLDAIQGKKSPEQTEHERREEAGIPQIENPWAPAPFVSTPEIEPCREIFREVVCIDGVPTPFSW